MAVRRLECVEAIGSDAAVRLSAPVAVKKASTRTIDRSKSQRPQSPYRLQHVGIVAARENAGEVDFT
jgi:hypothetical protein